MVSKRGRPRKYMGSARKSLSASLPVNVYEFLQEASNESGKTVGHITYEALVTELRVVYSKDLSRGTDTFLRNLHLYDWTEAIKENKK